MVRWSLKRVLTAVPFSPNERTTPDLMRVLLASRCRLRRLTLVNDYSTVELSSMRTPILSTGTIPVRAGPYLASIRSLSEPHRARCMLMSVPLGR